MNSINLTTPPEGTNSTLIRVLEIAPPTSEYCFGHGRQRIFVERDWFHDSFAPGGEVAFEGEDPRTYSITTEEGRQWLAQHLTEKVYFDPACAYLILHATHTFTINYYAASDPGREARERARVQGMADAITRERDKLVPIIGGQPQGHA